MDESLRREMDESLKREWDHISTRVLKLLDKAKSSTESMIEVSAELGGLKLAVSSHGGSSVLEDKILTEAICKKIIGDRWTYRVVQEFSGEVSIIPERFVYHADHCH